MKSYLNYYLVFIGIFFHAQLLCQLPINPNKTDSNGKRQGKWTIGFNKHWSPTTNVDSIAFYRIIEYADDKPIGITKDYYRKGTLQWEGVLLADRPQDIFDFNRDIHFYKPNQEEDIFKGQMARINYFARQGKFVEALPICESAVAMTSDSIHFDRQDYITALSTLATLAYRMGNYSQAENILIKLIKVREREQGKHYPDYANTLNNLALLYEQAGQYQKAEHVYLQAIEIYDSSMGKENLAYATSINNLAELYRTMGYYQKAEPLYQESLSIKEKLIGKEHPDYALSLGNFGLLYFKLGDYVKAENLYLRTLDIIFKSSGKNNYYYTTLLNNLADLYNHLGNYKKAEELLLEASSIEEKILGTTHPNYANTLKNLADVYRNMQEFSKAESYYQNAQAIYLKVYGKVHPRYATLLNNMAVLREEMGQYQQAEALYTEATEITSRFAGKHHPEYASTLSNLALIRSRLGRFAEGEPLLLEARDIIEKNLGKEHPSFSLSLYNLAELYQGSGNFAKARPLYLEAISLKMNQITRYFHSMSEREKQFYYYSNKVYFLNFELFCIDYFERDPSLVSELYNLNLVTKGLLIGAETKIRKNILNSGNPQLIEKFNQWKSTNEELLKAYQMSRSEKETKGIDENKLLDEVNKIEKELSMSSYGFRTMKTEHQFKWEGVRNKLKEGEVAIEMVRTNKKVNGQSLPFPVYAALIIKPSTKSYPEIVVLDNGKDLETLYVKYYRNSIRQKIRDEVSYIQFWKPISDKIKGAKKIYFSVDGVYNQINLNTLYNPTTGKYVIDEMDVQVVTSTKNLLTKSPSLKSGIKDATLFGYPNYNDSKNSTVQTGQQSNFELAKTLDMKTDSSQRFLNGENINELPGTKIEVQTIEALLKKKNVVMHEYIFDQATEAEIKRLNNPQVLHIATHGFFLSDLPLPKENERGFAGMETKRIVENPLLRSGLLFAGAKNAFDETKRMENGEDGILTAYEAMSLDLDQTDLVVMSACETGLGVTSNGEGVYGLQRAFQVAGAKSVLMSLWTVSDEATQQLMTSFYENWLGGKNPREAFRMSQLSLRTKYPEPYYWGAFVLVGD